MAHTAHDCVVFNVWRYVQRAGSVRMRCMAGRVLVLSWCPFKKHVSDTYACEDLGRRALRHRFLSVLILCCAPG